MEELISCNIWSFQTLKLGWHSPEEEIVLSRASFEEKLI